MTETPIVHRKITVFAPMEEGDPYVAFVGPVSSRLCFSGPSPMMATQAADKWRHEQYARVVTAETYRSVTGREPPPTKPRKKA